MKTEKKYARRTYILKADSIKLLDYLSERFSREARFELSRGKIIDLLVFYCRKKTFQELTKETE